MNVLLSERCEGVMNQFMEIGESLDHDWFTQYFEEEHANKSKMAQDFTPRGVSDLLSHIIGEAETVADVCSGTGGLTIAQWNKNRETRFYCYELSERAIPLLLFNLAIRNIKAKVVRMDILTGERFKAWEVVKGNVYGRVVSCDIPEEFDKVDAVISNPPYSQKYNPKGDGRFPQFADMLPNNYAEFVFVAFSLSITKENGKMGFVLPHGVLFRGSKEQKFRQTLIKRKMIKSVIGLPDKLFINTSIPVLILEIDTSGTCDDVLFIDAKDEALAYRKLNILDEPHIQKIAKAIDERIDVERFATVADLKTIEDNSYNLNIPRYVDTFIPEPLPDPIELLTDLAKTQRDIYETETKLFKEMAKLKGTNKRSEATFAKALAEYVKVLNDGEESYKKEVTQIESDRQNEI